MQTDLYAASPVGTLVPISGYDNRHNEDYEHYAFLPDPLPAAIDLTPETWLAVTEAAQALGRLDQAGRHLPKPWLVVRPQIRKEAHATSALEGTYAAFTDVLEAELETVGQSPEIVEILNYVATAELAFEWIQHRPVSLDMVCSLQARLVQGTRSDNQDAGRIRTSQVVIGPERCRVKEARFIPPPPGDLLRDGLLEWEAWVNTPHADLPIIATLALAHYQFETLHPFSDGNGRIGRLVIVLQLMQEGHLIQPLLTISPWLEQRRRDYQQHLASVSQTGDFDPWIRFFATGVHAQSDAAVAKIDQLIAFQAHVRDVIQQNRIRGIGRDIAEELIGRPIVTPTFAAAHYGKSYPAANSGIQRLVEAGLLREATGRRYDRVFVSDEIMRIIEF